MLAPLHTSRRYRVDVTYRAPRWMPWLTIGLGVAAVGTGAVSYQLGRRDRTQFDEQFVAPTRRDHRRQLLEFLSPSAGVAAMSFEDDR